MTALFQRRSVQAPGSVVMIRPDNFHPNAETAGDNLFQSGPGERSPKEIAQGAWREVDRAAQMLNDVGVRVHVVNDPATDRPDAVFPNNWFSTHPGGHVAIFPMYAPNRRRERRSDVIDTLKSEYRVQDIVDYSGLEPDGLFLEGTGAMVLDHIDRVAYVARSNRADPIALERFCTQFHYEPMVFDASDATGVPIYHTNVLMCVATEFALVGLDMIADAARRAEVRHRLEGSGRQVIALSHEQIGDFAGNAIELQGEDKRVLALSTRALASLRPDQVSKIQSSATPLPLDVPTIELAGGSVRCMLAGIHLGRR